MIKKQSLLKNLVAGIAGISVYTTIPLWGGMQSACAADDKEASHPGRGLGFYYTNEVTPDIPMSAHIVRVERTHSELCFGTTLGKGTELGMETVPEQLKLMPAGLGRPVAAINGDYFEKNPNYQGRSRNIQIYQGELISSPSGHCAFWITPDGQPRMTNVYSSFCVTFSNGKTNALGLNEFRSDDAAVLYTVVVGSSTRTINGVELVLEGVPNGNWLPLRAGTEYQARVRSVNLQGDTPTDTNVVVLSIGPKLASMVGTNKVGDVIKFYAGTIPDLKGVTMAIGGGPSLVESGKAMHWNSLIKTKHPRTAIGWNKDYFFMVEVDGRQSDVSVGMTYPELAEYMVKLGCEWAMNLDGGGSSTFWLMGNVVNSPSEGHERPAPNALVLIRQNSK